MPHIIFCYSRDKKMAELSWFLRFNEFPFPHLLHGSCHTSAVCLCTGASLVSLGGAGSSTHGLCLWEAGFLSNLKVWWESNIVISHSRYYLYTDRSANAKKMVLYFADVINYLICIFHFLECFTSSICFIKRRGLWTTSLTWTTVHLIILFQFLNIFPIYFEVKHWITSHGVTILTI